MLVGSQDLSNPEQIAVFVHDCELSQAPRLVFERVHSRDALSWQGGPREGLVETVNVSHPDVATRRGFGGTQLGMQEEVKLQAAAREDGVGVARPQYLAFKPELPIEVQRLVERSARQDGNRDVVLRHGDP
jgi:hypothetical protein